MLLRVGEDDGEDIAKRTTAADVLHSVLELHERDRVLVIATTTASADLCQHLEKLADSGAEPTDGDSHATRRLGTGERGG